LPAAAEQIDDCMLGVCWMQSYGSTYAYVTKVNVDGQYAYFNVKGNFRSDHGCKKASYVAIDLDDPRTKPMIAIAMTSFLSKAEVYVRTEGCSGNWAYPYVVQLQLYQD